MKPYNPLSSYWKKKFGTRVWKIPLDAGFDCPNRDGTLSMKGCIFCNEHGSGTGLHHKSISLKDQYHLFRARLTKKHGPVKFAAYLQSYSNTYGPLDKIRMTLENLHGLEDLAVLCVGTRPDCLDQAKADLLGEFPCPEVWLDLGLQSSCDSTLELINRGHTSRDFALAAETAAGQGLLVCAHVIAGLPGERRAHFIRTIRFLNSLPVKGIKIHNLYVCRNTALADQWQKGGFQPLKADEYIHWVAQGLANLRQDIIIHRLTGDPAPGELLAPSWASNKNTTLNKLKEHLAQADIWQGKNLEQHEN